MIQYQTSNARLSWRDGFVRQRERFLPHHRYIYYKCGSTQNAKTRNSLTKLATRHAYNTPSNSILATAAGNFGHGLSSPTRFVPNSITTESATNIRCMQSAHHRSEPSSQRRPNYPSFASHTGRLLNSGVDNITHMMRRMSPSPHPQHHLAQQSCAVFKNNLSVINNNTDIKNITFGHLNVATLTVRKMKYLSDIFKPSDYEIISLCETNLWKKPYNIQIPGYITYEKRRKGKGGGVSLSISNTIF